MLTENQLKQVFDDALPLCNGDTSDLWEWLVAGNEGADISHYTAEDIANEWNEYTQQATEVHAAAVALGRKGGRSTSDAKRNASRQNGKLGGRPKTKQS